MVKLSLGVETVKLLMAFLLEDCVGEYTCPRDEELRERWVTRIRPLRKDTQIQEDELYTVSEDAQLPPVSEGKEIPLLVWGRTAPVPKGYLAAHVDPKQDVERVTEQIQDAFAEFEDWYVSLLRSVSFGSGLEELLNATMNMTPNHIYVADMSFKVLAYMDRAYMGEMSATWRYQLAHGYLPVHVMKGMIESGEFAALNGFHIAQHFYSENFYVPFVTKNIFYKNRVQAHLFLVNMVKRPCARDRVVAQILGELLEQHFSLLSPYNLNRVNNNYEAFFNDVLSGTCADEDVIAKQLDLFNWGMNDLFGMAVIDVTNRDDGLRNAVIYEVESRTDWMCFLHGDDVVVLANVSRQEGDTERPMLKRLAEQYGLEICMGVPFRGFTQIGAQYRLMCQIRNLARQNADRQNSLYIETADYSLPYIVSRVRATPEMVALCAPQAHVLRMHDGENHTEFFETCYAYLLRDRNIVRTSAALHIHRNTLMYRLEKIDKLIGLDEMDDVRKIHLLMSLMVLRDENTRA
ncbi:MAG: helix-turn-helix domain-containing protein [Oscillospiraceae bacterium]|nr:helix-turn-helix domain-containing protein [Oscillospiraceae bacterium]